MQSPLLNRFEVRCPAHLSPGAYSRGRPLVETLRMAGTVEFMVSTLRSTRRGARMLVNSLAAILPHHPKGDIKHWTGLRPLTPSGRPLVGRTRLASLLVNTEHGPLGWTLALAQRVHRLSGRQQGFAARPLAPFDPERNTAVPSGS